MKVPEARDLFPEVVSQHRYCDGDNVLFLDDRSHSQNKGGNPKVGKFLGYSSNGNGVNAIIKVALQPKPQYLNPRNIVGIHRQ